jgi:hypothetical protein
MTSVSEWQFIDGKWQLVETDDDRHSGLAEAAAVLPWWLATLLAVLAGIRGLWRRIRRKSGQGSDGPSGGQTSPP